METFYNLAIFLPKKCYKSRKIQQKRSPVHYKQQQTPSLTAYQSSNTHSIVTAYKPT